MRLAFFTIALISLIGLSLLTAFASALRRSHKRDSKKQLKEIGGFFTYRPFYLFFFPKDEYEGLLFSIICAQNVSRFFFLTSMTFFMWNEAYLLSWGALTLLTLLLIVIFFAIGDYLPRILGSRYPAKIIWLTAPLTSPFLFLAFPLSYLFIKLSHLMWRTVHFDYLSAPMAEAKQEIFNIIQEAEFTSKLNTHDKKLIESVVGFQERIAREVMVPRVDIFSLSADTSIEEAARLLQEEGYSRIPVYRGTVDQIVGVLMYKDVLNKYMEYIAKGCDPKILQTPVETIVKNVLYTPETKKISNLLQEFRKKQLHLAIVVDEYGGTEGIVTIEDILEEIVGEIEDEYDEEEDLFIAQPDGSWIVDARMSILDVDEQLGIEIPQNVEYDTIGGYIFHRAGSIPTKGFAIKLDDFQLEVLKSNDRRVEKVRIKPTSAKESEKGKVEEKDEG